MATLAAEDAVIAGISHAIKMVVGAETFKLPATWFVARRAATFDFGQPLQPGLNATKRLRDFRKFHASSAGIDM
jgi:hypothetical protein